jgi:sulfatase modifying factor 1
MTMVYIIWPVTLVSGVMDVYRPLTLEDAQDFRPFRGNVFETKQLDEDGLIAEKDSLGKLIYREVNMELDNLQERRNYRQADNINYVDGHWESTIYYIEGEEGVKDIGNRSMYEYSATSLVNDRVRVYKGGSWKDRAYWLNPGTRRFLEEDQATEFIGFRCAMTRVGSPVGLGK